MTRFHKRLMAILFFSATGTPGAVAFACDQGFDGCLGCSDDQLPACLQTMVQEICQVSGDPANCDTQRVYDDAERNVLISTGSHMARIHSMARSARKYQHH